MSIASATLKARDVMTAEPVCIEPQATIRELARTLEEHEISGVPVVDQQGVLIGVVSRTDLVRRCTEGVDDMPPAYLFEILSEQSDGDDVSEVMPEPLICVEDFMTEDPVTASPETPVATLARQMSDKGIHRVVIVDEERFPLGIVTSLDLLRRWPR